MVTRNVLEENAPVKSSVVRQRREMCERAASQTKQDLNPQSSFRDGDSVQPKALCKQDALQRTRSVPLKRHSAAGSVLTRLVSCVACGRVETESSAAETPPRRLRSGDVDLFADCSKGDLAPSVRGGGLQIFEASAETKTYAQMRELLEFNWAFCKALENSDIMQIRLKENALLQSGRVFELLGIHEELNVRGEQVVCRRQDPRRGPLFARTFLTPTGYINKLHWSEPCSGGLVETMEFSDDGKELQTRMHVYRTDGRSCDLMLIWKRQNKQPHQLVE